MPWSRINESPPACSVDLPIWCSMLYFPQPVRNELAMASMVRLSMANCLATFVARRYVSGHWRSHSGKSPSAVCSICAVGLVVGGNVVGVLREKCYEFGAEKTECVVFHSNFVAVMDIVVRKIVWRKSLPAKFGKKTVLRETFHTAWSRVKQSREPALQEIVSCLRLVDGIVGNCFGKDIKVCLPSVRI